ncbi:MAG: type III-B CRISPR module-associated Cmr3 family protein [Acidobacteriota bacterium]|nr:type III-B CRISPR module-associated Cmr3 family protein [Acidobacteriota bacterium]
MKGMQFEPVDTLFFRGGTPFTMDRDPQEDVSSVFPPHPPSMAGVVRAALALANGWDGRSRWPAGTEKVLGSGPDNLGDISLAGPFVLRNSQPLFPLPRHVVGKDVQGVWQPRMLLRPGRPVVCDLGKDVRLPEPPRDGSAEIAQLEATDDIWVSRAGLSSVLRGDIPAVGELYHRRDLWGEEPRIGLERETATRTAREGMLYSTRHVRLRRGVSLGVRADGVPTTWNTPFGQLVPLGGESRLVEVREWNGAVDVDMPLEKICKSGRFTVIALTPVDLDPEIVTGRRPLREASNAMVISACLSRPLRIGGWDSLAHKPLPLHSILPAGSVLFCFTSDPSRLEVAIENGRLLRIGSRTAQGFGVVAFGSWDD